MDGEPRGADLLDAVEGALRERILPALSGDARYQGLMVASAVAMVARELREGARLAAAEAGVRALLGDDGRAAIRAGRHDGDAALHAALLDLARTATRITSRKAHGAALRPPSTAGAGGAD